MKQSIFLIEIAIVFLLAGCKHPGNMDEAKHIIKINEKNSRDYDISKSTEFIKCIPLETTDKSLIKHIEKIFLTDSLIIIFDDELNEIFLFDTNGRYVRTFGKKGIGPGEHEYYSDVFFEKSTGLLYAHEVIKRVMYIYDLNGNLINEVPTKNIWFRSFCKVKDGYWIYTGYKNDNYSYSVLKTDSNFQIIKGFLPQEEFFRTMIHTTFIQNQNDELFFISPYGNVVYQLENEMMTPFLKIDFGSKALPYDEITRMSRFEYDQTIDNKGYFGFMEDFLFYNNKFYFSFLNMAPESTLYFTWYNMENSTVELYRSNLEYHPDEFPFKHLTLMHPQSAYGLDAIYPIEPYRLDEEDLQVLQAMSDVLVNTDSNPVLFFIRSR